MRDLLVHRWACAATRLLFGSEIKSIAESGLVQRRAREGALPESLGTCYVLGTKTSLDEVYRLQRGHTLIYENGDTTIPEYWDIPAGSEPDRAQRASDSDLIRRFRDLLEESVRIRFMAHRAAQHVPLRWARRRRHMKLRAITTKRRHLLLDVRSRQRVIIPSSAARLRATA